jgi:hypothetical protein
MSRYDSILSSLARLDAEPGQLQLQVDGVRTGLLALSTGCSRSKKHAERAARLYGQIEALTVRLAAGKKKSLGDVIKDLRKATPPDLLADITEENVYRTGPFLYLGNLPVGVNGSAGSTRLRDVFQVFGSAGQRRLPRSTGHPMCHTLWVYEEQSWWSTLLYNHYSASTWTTATGWDACDLLGGQYQQAKEACKTLVVPPQDDPSAFIIAFLKAAACNYAASAPETPFPALSIDTIACSCLTKGADGSCDPIKKTLEGFKLDEVCSQKVRTNTAGPVKAVYTSWGGDCMGVTSRHFVTLVPGVMVQDYWC